MRRRRRDAARCLASTWTGRVQESGLVKDTIVLDIPDEAGNFDTVLVRRAADKLKDSSAAGREYAAQTQEC